MEDGQVSLSVKFAGSVFLDRSDPADVALFNEISEGSDVMLTVEGLGGSSKLIDSSSRRTVEKLIRVHAVFGLRA